jgi:DNA-binding MarR family transcriptional regulator
MRAVDIHSKQLALNFNLTGPQLLILRELHRRGELTLGQLAREVSLSKGTVTGIVDRLERRALLTRLRGTRDRRQVIVRVTPEGEALLSTAPPLLQESFLKQFLRLSDSERDKILQALKKVASMMGADELDAAPLLESNTIECFAQPGAVGETTAGNRSQSKKREELSLDS